MRIPPVTTPAEQEAERRYQSVFASRDQATFVAGAEWALEQHRELLEAAREYREARRKHLKGWIAYAEVERVASRLLAAAAVLPGDS